MTESDQSRIAVLESRVSELTRRVDTHEKKVDEKLDHILESLALVHKDINTVKGGWYGLFAILSLAGGIGALIGRFILPSG